MAADEKQLRADRMKAIRLGFGFTTQEALAEASPDQSLERTYVNRAENAKNAVTTHALQKSFADALGLPVADLAEYLDGRISLAEVKRRRNAAQDRPAAPFIHGLERIPGLKAWAQKKGNGVTIAEIVEGVTLIQSGTTAYARFKDAQPHGGWDAFFADLRAGKLQTDQTGGGDVKTLREAEMAELSKQTKSDIVLPPSKKRAQRRTR